MGTEMWKAAEFSAETDEIPGLEELIAWMERTWGRPFVVRSLTVKDEDGTEVRLEPEEIVPDVLPLKRW